jgi:hypothetical protein
MHAVGFQHKKKHHFVDGHKRLEMLACQPVLTKKYLENETQASSPMDTNDTKRVKRVGVYRPCSY